MKKILVEFLLKFLFHSVIFACLIYFLTNFTIQKTALFAGSFGLVMSFFNSYQKKNKKS